MNTWIWLMLATSPFAFLISYHFTYRWTFFDSGGGSKLFWKMLRTDLHCSIPGRHGDIARIARCRGWVRKYAKMEGPHSAVVISGIDEPFMNILHHQKYQEYERFFMPPKWWIWAKMAACLVWPIALLLWLVVNVMVLAWPIFCPPQHSRP